MSDLEQQLDAIKTPPHSLEAERSVLGGLLLEPGVWEQVSTLLVAQDFYSPAHTMIFESIEDLNAAKFAFNDTHSQSGYHGPLGYAVSQGIELNPTHETGSRSKC